MAGNLLQRGEVESSDLDEVLQEDSEERKGEAAYKTASPAVGRGPDGPGDDDDNDDGDADEDGWPPDEPGD